MKKVHSHPQLKTKNPSHEKYLWMALAITCSFIVVELIGSWLSGSLALLSDAAHLFTDAAALMISIIAMRLSKKIADKKRTFGYYRIEILAAAINAGLLFVVSFFIFYEAYQRFFTPTEIQSLSMLIIALIGLIANLICMRLIYPGSLENLNIKSAYLDARADMLSSLGVIVTAVLIYFTKWQSFDSIVAVGISLWILPRAWTLLKECINILLEGVPEGIILSEVKDVLVTLKGVNDVHDVHVWALSSGKISLTAHLVVDKSKEDYQSLLKAVSQILEDKFNITHTTIQIETVKCEHDDDRF
jgi:cobalt-zinc-cadmium efflux system protein